MTIQIGTYGWLNPRWNGSFYDSDLPEEWKLSWYSNHFRTVVVPSEEVLKLSVDTIDQWVEDTDPDFRFILEIDSKFFIQNRSNELSCKFRMFENHFEGQLDAVICKSTRAKLIKHDECENVQTGLSRAIVCVNTSGCDPMFEKYGRSSIDDQLPEMKPNPFAIVYSSRGQLPLIRENLENMKRLNSEKRALIFNHQSSAYHHAAQARILADLMGGV
ncbi:MAG: hypothetical protein GY922_00630 [Proteobacteria bacterium]|nr:hypothetical protein [Pseudomonadota bacterium]